MERIEDKFSKKSLPNGAEIRLNLYRDDHQEAGMGLPQLFIKKKN